jgi:hypothetical protein
LVHILANEIGRSSHGWARCSGSQSPSLEILNGYTPMIRRFPSPWCVEDIGGCFVVKADNGQPLVFIHYGERAS